MTRTTAEAPAPTLAAQAPAEAMDVAQMTESAREAAAFLKALAHEGRLMILCHLSGGEKSVTALEQLLDSRQAAVSQQLARLRMEGLVDNRRDGKTIYYRIANPRVAQMIATVHEMFCAPRP
jgi:ArsR family transcriptional regulator